jgi:Myb-like DNA-binding protein FlbD
LLSLVNLHGAHNWVRISQAIQTRSPKQCRERFHQNLKPNLNHDPITPEEGVLIEQMVAEMGKRWAEIARRLRGRSDNAVKNWWNGGMNRRRRSNQQRRTEFEVRQQANPSAAPSHGHPLTTHQHPLPPGFAPLQPHFFTHPVYQPVAGHMPQPIRLPSNGPPLRSHGLIETPLPSPSAYSQLSTDGAPSLVSDNSSSSARSPNNGGSPIELPPLSGARSERRQSQAPMLQLGVPGSFVQEQDFQMPMQRYSAEKHNPRMLQEPFMPAQSFPHPSQYLPSQPRHPSPLQAYALPPQPQHKMEQQQFHSHHAPVTQLPSISNMQGFETSQQLDPSLQHVRCTPVPSAPTPDGSPKDKMSLSNLTH